MKSIKNKYFFFLPRIIKDILNPKVWKISKDIYSKELLEYYFVFTEEAMSKQKGGQKSIVMDDEGIPQNPTYIDVKDKKFVYFPITIGQVGLAVYHSYLKTKSKNSKNRFMKFAYWFLDNLQYDKGLGVRWLTDVKLPQYRNPGPWQSAFSQSRGISILLRAYQITGQKKYLSIANKALIPFTKPVSEGGVTSYTEWGPFYEEYTAQIPTLVLNGMIFSLCGVYDFIRVVPENKLAKKIFFAGVETLENILPKFNLGYWSRYNFCQAEWYPKIDPATNHYQRLHINQLKLLYNLTNKIIFKKFALKFERQINLWNILIMYFQKFKALKELKRV